MDKEIKLKFTDTKVKILKETLDEKSGDSTLKVQVKWQQADKININNRSYPEKILRSEIDRIQEKLPKGQVTGSAYHPSGRDANTIDVSHKWDKIWMEEDGSCLGELTIIPTTVGKTVITLIKNGVNPALSSRGYGTTTKKSKNVDGKNVAFDEVNSDFKLVSPGDFVLSPSVKDARIQAIMESEEGGKMKKELSEDEKTMAGYEYAKKTGYAGNLKQFKSTLKINQSEIDAHARAKQAGYRGDFETYKKQVLKKED